MEYEWDENKRQGNLTKHGIDFATVVFFDWEHAIIESDLRRDYGEMRYVAYAQNPQADLLVLTFTMRAGRIRVISYRKANGRERRKYAPIY